MWNTHLVFEAFALYNGKQFAGLCTGMRVDFESLDLGQGICLETMISPAGFSSIGEAKQSLTVGNEYRLHF